jgi:hypothetical protein
MTGAISLALWIAVAAWASYALATAWPYVQLMPQWLLVFALPGILFRVLDLGWMQAQGRRLAGWRRWAARAATIGAGLAAAGGLWTALDGISMGRFERALAPLVAQVHARAAAPCPPAAQYVPDPALAAYLEASGAPRAPLNLHHGRERFVLVLMGGSMDIDGSSLFYDSRPRQWRKVHNDILARSGELQALLKDLESCRIPLRA